MKKFEWSMKSIVIATLITAVCIVGPYLYFAASSDYFGSVSPSGFGQFGAYVGGTAGAIFGIFSAILLFGTYRSQSAQFKLSRQEIELRMFLDISPEIKRAIINHAQKRRVQFVSKIDANSESALGEISDPRLIKIDVNKSPKKNLTSFEQLIENQLSNDPDYKTAGLYVTHLAKTYAQRNNAKCQLEVILDINEYSEHILIFVAMLKRLIFVGTPTVYAVREFRWITKYFDTLIEVFDEVVGPNGRSSESAKQIREQLIECRDWVLRVVSKSCSLGAKF